MVSESSFPNGKMIFEKYIYHFYFDKVQCRKKSGIRIAFSEGHIQKDLDKLMVRTNLGMFGVVWGIYALFWFVCTELQ